MDPQQCTNTVTPARWLLSLLKDSHVLSMKDLCHRLWSIWWTNYSKSSNIVISFNVFLLWCWRERENWYPSRTTMCVWSIRVLPCLHGSSAGTLVSSHIPKMCPLGALCVHIVSEWARVCVCVCMCAPVREGHPAQGGSHLAPWAGCRGSGHLWPWTTINGLEKILLLVFMNMS